LCPSSPQLAHASFITLLRALLAKLINKSILLLLLLLLHYSSNISSSSCWKDVTAAAGILWNKSFAKSGMLPHDIINQIECSFGKR
jgi:hypothetical protein